MTDPRPTYDELAARVAELESRFADGVLHLEVLPWQAFLRKLEQSWTPDPQWFNG